MDEVEDEMAYEVGSGGGVSLRLVAAMPLPAETAHVLADYADALVDMGCIATDPTALHVTFAFLGDVAEEHVPMIATALDAAASRVPGATGCAVHGVDAYGSGRALGVDVDVELLAPIAAARDRFIEAVMPYAIGVDRRPWRPHATVARMQGTALLDDVELPLPPAASWVAGDLRLYASLPGLAGRQHRLLHAAPLGTGVRQG
jgi:2'-5' RNA ligase